jgi:hypothetical protein
MCGKETQSFHFCDALSSGVYSIIWRLLAISNAVSHTSILYGYQLAAA